MSDLTDATATGGVPAVTGASSARAHATTQVTHTQVWLARHGQTDWNREQRLQGHSDIALNAEGQRQAQQLMQQLTPQPLHAIHSSDLSRAVMTAAPLAQARGLQVQRHVALRERCYGAFEGLQRHELAQRFPQEVADWQARLPHWTPPGGGESFVQLQARVTQALHAIAKQHTGQSILVVVHGGVLDALYRFIHQLSYTRPRTWSIDNAIPLRLHFDASASMPWHVEHWSQVE